MNYQKAIYICSTLLLLFSLILGILLLNGEEEPKQGTEESSYTIHTIPLSKISALAVKNSRGSYGLMLSQTGRIDLVSKPPLPQEQLSQKEMQGALYMASKLVAVKSLKQVSELSAYGLQEASATISILLRDGSKLRFRLGKQEPINGDYYFYHEGEKSIYLIGKLTADIFLRRPIDYWNKQLLPELLNDSVDKLEEIRLTGASEKGNSWEIKQQKKGEFFLTDPAELKLSSETVFSDLVIPLSALRPEKLESLDQDPSEYGLDQAEHRLEILHNGSRHVLLFQPDGNGAYFLQKEGSPAVFSLSSDAASFLSIAYRDLIGEYAYQGSMAALSTIKIHDKRSGERYNLTVFGEGSDLYAVYKGESIAYTDLSEALTPLYRIGIVGEAQKAISEEVLQDAFFTLEIEKRNGTLDRIAFYRKNNDIAYVEINGTVQFLSYIRAADAIVDAMASLSH